MGCNVFAAADNDVLDPSGQMQIAVCVEKSLVPGTKPSLNKRTSIGFRIVFVSAKHVRSLNDDLTSLVGSEVIALRVHDADTNAGPHAYGTRLAMPGRQRIGGHLVRRFGHAVSFDEGHSENLFHLVNGLRRKWRTAGADKP